MKRYFERLALALGTLCAVAMPCLAASITNGSIYAGHARFTPITPECIRLEYSQTGQFVDDPSYFAADRTARDSAVKVSTSGNRTTIDTGEIRLTYVDDGSKFDSSNLSAKIRDGQTWADWNPSMANDANLGGAIRTLDGWDGAGPLDDGLLSRNGWYLLDDSRGVLLENDWPKSRPKDAGTDWYLFGYGTDYRAALKSLAAVSGPVPLPRRYMLGEWYSRYWPYSSADYREIVGEYASHDFPLDNLVLDMDWHLDGWTGWSWNRKLLPDAEDLLQWLHSQGIHDTLNLHPADGVAPHETQYAAFMRDLGKDPASGATVPFDAADRRYMDALFRDVIAPLEHDGVDFWWLDWQQYPFTRSVPDLTNLAWLNQLLYEHTSEGGKRGASFSRWAGWGDQRHPIHFSGDASTRFKMLAFEVSMTAASGNSGCFFWTHDIGGHNRGRNEESYTRWVQFGAMSAALRAHSTRDATMDRRPWTYPKWAEDSMRGSAHLRSMLFPYIYTSAAQSSRETVPMLRPMYFDDPTTEAAYHNAQEYLLGDNLLVAPIVSAGVGPGRVASQTAWFPKSSDWYDWFSGVRHAGGSDALIADDIDEFPLFVRGGVPIPMQPYTARMASTPITTLVVRCYPGTRGTSTLYEDDGESTAYRSNAFAATPLTYSRIGGKVTVEIGAARGRFAGQPRQRAYVIQLASMGRPARVLVDGHVAAADYSPRLGIDSVAIAPQPIDKPVTVTVFAKPLAQDDLQNSAEMETIAGVLGDDWGHSTAARVLADSRMSTLDQDHLSAVLAACGIGLVAHDESVYGYEGDRRLVLYAPASTGVDAELHLVSPALPAVSRMGMGNGQEIGYADVTVAGHTYRLPSTPLATEDNVALSATVTASSTQPGYTPRAAIDGVVDGYPQNPGAEWASDHEKAGAWLKLTWNTPRTIDRIVLYDRPNTGDQVLSGKLTFDDGSSVDVGALPDDASSGLEVKFPAKTTASVTFTVTSVKPSTVSIGLSEIAVYRAAQ